MELHFWNSEIYQSYDDAKSAGALFKCEAPAFDDEVHRYGFSGGVLCDAMQAVSTAARCLGMSGALNAALVTDDEIIFW